MDQIRLGLLGCGKVGQKHLQALVHQKDFKLVATADIDLERAQAAAVAFDAQAYASLEDLLAGSAIDAIVIAVPSGLHRDLGEKALQARVHVMIEKPLTLRYADAHALVELSKKMQRQLAVTQFSRFIPAIADMMAAVHAGRLGQMVTGGITVHWARPQSYYEDAPWRGNYALDGGVLFDQALHALDVLVQTMGPVDEVFAATGALTHQDTVEDTAVGSLRFASGALATLSATTSVPQKNLEERVTVIGESGVIVIGPTLQQIQTWRVAGDNEENVCQMNEERPNRPSWQSHADALSDWAEAIYGIAPLALSAESTMETIAVAEALALSAQNGRPMKV
ncbi:MAG: Gfo/Idh/MocA family oxidoreductase, partial [Firmicutes bacterium]|nr:Gfo/Idh/MocA family oxidoreductase [Bacillota bacterium]